jgi:citrate synthase
MALEKIAPEDEFFVYCCSRIFAMARNVGWAAQWDEMNADPERKIGRPRQPFIGSPKRDMAPIDKR